MPPSTHLLAVHVSGETKVEENRRFEIPSSSRIQPKIFLLLLSNFPGSQNYEAN
jgi:hypothetical protein